jgi:hypothetical protein
MYEQLTEYINILPFEKPGTGQPDLVAALLKAAEAEYPAVLLAVTSIFATIKSLGLSICSPLDMGRYFWRQMFAEEDHCNGLTRAAVFVVKTLAFVVEGMVQHPPDEYVVEEDESDDEEEEPEDVVNAVAAPVSPADAMPWNPSDDAVDDSVSYRKYSVRQYFDHIVRIINAQSGEGLTDVEVEAREGLLKMLQDNAETEDAQRLCYRKILDSARLWWGGVSAKAVTRNEFQRQVGPRSNPTDSVKNQSKLYLLWNVFKDM